MRETEHQNPWGRIKRGSGEAGRRQDVRLFVLLALLVPLFAGLHFLVRESVPRVEVQTVTVQAPAPPVVVSVDVPVDRVVERVVYVPVDRIEAAPTGESNPSDVPEPLAATVTQDADLPQVANAAPGVPASEEIVAEGAGPSAANEPVAAEEPVIGLVALAPPPPAPAIAPVAPVAAVVRPIVVQAPVEAASEEEEEVVADAEDDQSEVAEGDGGAEDEVVAEAPADEPAVIQVIETTLGSAPKTEIVSYRVATGERVPAEPSEAEQPEAESADPGPELAPDEAEAPATDQQDEATNGDVPAAGAMPASESESADQVADEAGDEMADQDAEPAESADEVAAEPEDAGGAAVLETESELTVSRDGSVVEVENGQ